jgi:hypothetical protein
MMGDFSLYMRRSLSVMAATFPAMSAQYSPERRVRNAGIALAADGV